MKLGAFCSVKARVLGFIKMAGIFAAILCKISLVAAELCVQGRSVGLKPQEVLINPGDLVTWGGTADTFTCLSCDWPEPGVQRIDPETGFPLITRAFKQPGIYAYSQPQPPDTSQNPSRGYGIIHVRKLEGPVPPVTIHHPIDGQFLPYLAYTPFLVSATNAPDAIGELQLLLDGKVVASTRSASNADWSRKGSVYELQFKPEFKVAPGPHVLQAAVFSTERVAQRSQTVELNVMPNPSRKEVGFLYGLQRLPNGMFLMRFVLDPIGRHEIQASDDFKEWTGRRFALAQYGLWIDELAPAVPKRFYRITIVPG